MEHGDKARKAGKGISLRIAKFVIPAKFRKAGREPGSRNNLVVLNFYWIPDLARRKRARPV
jgi:hypothetical protein